MIARLLRALTLRRRWIYRDAATGAFVSRAFAEANPATTVRERMVRARA